MIALKLPDPIRIFGKKRSTWTCCTAFLILVQLIVVLLTFTDYGITIDEPPQAEYGKAIFDWFRSGFQDPEFFNRIRTIDLERYGGLFDTLVYPLTRLLPFDRFETRHLCNALIGLLGIGIIYRLGAHIGSPGVGFLAALFLILTPRYYGHSFNNPKDIPFAVCYLLSLYHLIRSVGMLPDLPWKQVWKTGLAIGLALGVRFGGLLLFVYLGLAFFIRYLNLARPADRRTRLSLLRNFVTQTTAIFAIAWTSMLAFWPRALIEPFTYPIQVLRFFSDFTRHNTTFFEGRPLSSVDVPWYYAPKWFLISSPEFLFIGLAIAPIIALAVLRHSQPLNTPILPWSILSLSAFFPLVYVILKGSPLYDGFRHFLFVLPPVALIAAASIHQALKKNLPPVLRLSLIGLLALLTGITLWDMIRLHPNQYVYFNRFVAGGIKQASKQYQTDYWENSYKQGIWWIDEN
ncbi:MAG: glycosyltransferase family 39 protein, partial [bacterium]|nr:glycosyltransferase family 39 protein [bacterium]